MTGDFRNWGKWEGGRQIRGKVDRIEGGENCTGGKLMIPRRDSAVDPSAGGGWVRREAGIGNSGMREKSG